MIKRKVGIIVMDGWGHGKKDHSNAIYKASTPYVDSLYKNYPNTELLTSGENVGLPDGQMGNSEVGHLNIGAGRVVYQELVRINKAIEDQSLFENEILEAAIVKAKEKSSSVHLLGLYSDGGVHSHFNHAKALIEACETAGLEKVFIHAFMDGRDTDPKSGLKAIKDLESFLAGKKTKLSSIIGRYFAMDRDQRWERVKKAYDLLVHGRGITFSDSTEAVQSSYDEGVTDEFMEPIKLYTGFNNKEDLISTDDVVVFYNFRTDRGRQLTRALAQENFEKFGMNTIPLHYVTMTSYDDNYKDVEVMYSKQNLKATLGDYLSSKGLNQFRAAETEKYPHVTFFFSGGREKPFEGESRVMVNSPKVATYDLQPEMSAPQLSNKVCELLAEGEQHFFCLNFANTDMVGHTGVFTAAIKAAETVDGCVKQVVEEALRQGFDILLTADHGNADFMINDDGSPNTAHTQNPVPLFWITDNANKNLRNGILGDLAPTVLELMELEIPSEMDGKSLLIDA